MNVVSRRFLFVFYSYVIDVVSRLFASYLYVSDRLRLRYWYELFVYFYPVFMKIECNACMYMYLLFLILLPSHVRQSLCYLN